MSVERCKESLDCCHHIQRFGKWLRPVDRGVWADLRNPPIQKFLVILFVVLKIEDQPLITVGDAAASFIEERDIMTQKMCLFTREYFSKESQIAKKLLQQDNLPKSYNLTEKRAARAASKLRWASAIFL